MNCDELVSALKLPVTSRVDQRVPKKLLLENGAPSAADKRLIHDGIEELFWLAALKPTTIGVPEFRDEAREYLEIAVLRVTVRPDSKLPRLMELIHRAVPYPTLLLLDQGEQVGLSTVHKRWSQGEIGKVVLDGEIVAVVEKGTSDSVPWAAFRDALAMDRQPHQSLHALYQGWIDSLLAFQAARITGTFVITADAGQSAARREALRECARLDVEMNRLRSAAAKERQMARRVEMNLELKRMGAAQTALRSQL